MSNLHPTRWSRLVLLASPLVLAGCQGEPATPTVSHSTSTDAASSPTATVPIIAADHSTSEQPVAIAPSEPAVTELRGDVQQASNTVTQGVDDLQSGVTRAVGQTQVETKQAASDMAVGFKGVADEVRDGANQAVTDTVNEIKTDAQQAVDGGKKQVRGAVDGAKADARRRAKAVGDDVRKSVEGVKDEVLNNLLGPAPKN